MALPAETLKLQRAQFKRKMTVALEEAKRTFEQQTGTILTDVKFSSTYTAARAPRTCPSCLTLKLISLFAR